MTTLPSVTSEKTKANNAIAFALDLRVLNKEGYDQALEKGKEIKSVLDSVVARREEITRPMNDALKSTRALFKPIETDLEEALRITKQKMMAWFTVEKNKQIETEQKLAQRVENGTMKPETAIKKSAEIAAPENHTVTDTATGTVRKERKVRFTDLKGMTSEEVRTLICGGYVVWDAVKARRDALAGTLTTGVEVYEEFNQSIS
jgi:hypothetical protein